MVSSNEISSPPTIIMNTSSLCPDCGFIFTENWMLKDYKREDMELFYRVNCLNKTGEGPGGKFNRPSIKTVLNNLKPFEDILPTEAFPFIEYIHSLKEVHEMCI